MLLRLKKSSFAYAAKGRFPPTVRFAIDAAFENAVVDHADGKVGFVPHSRLSPSYLALISYANTAKVGKEPIVLKNSVFGSDGWIFRHTSRRAFGWEGFSAKLAFRRSCVSSLCLTNDLI